MTTETSYNQTFAPFAQWAAPQAPIPQATHNLPGTIAANGSASTSLIVTEGFSMISAGITVTQAGTVSIQRYLDAGGTVPQGAAISATVSANVAANLDVLDGKPFASFVLTVTNNSGSSATISKFALLAQTGANDVIGVGGLDGSTTITTGGTAQSLFGGITPINGFFVTNPDATNDLWLSLSTNAVANGTGSVRIAANGGYFASEPGVKPWQAISIVGAVTGQKVTAARW